MKDSKPISVSSCQISGIFHVTHKKAPFPIVLPEHPELPQCWCDCTQHVSKGAGELLSAAVVQPPCNPTPTLSQHLMWWESMDFGIPLMAVNEKKSVRGSKTVNNKKVVFMKTAKNL